MGLSVGFQTRAQTQIKNSIQFSNSKFNNRTELEKVLKY